MTPLELLALFFMMIQGGGVKTYAYGTLEEPTGPTKPTPTPSKPTPAKPKPTPAKPTPPRPSKVILPASTETPKPWPAVTPSLPKYPTGWEPYVPPPPSVVSRANQLLPEMWKSGKVGVTKVEQTDGVWVTYVTFSPAKGKRGVAAYRLKEGAASSVIPASTKGGSKKRTIKA